MAAPIETLHGEALRAAVAPWREEVGKADRDRLDALVSIATARRIKLSECIRATFPELPLNAAVAALASFQGRINDAAGAAKPALALRFHVDTRRQSPPEERECWFTEAAPAVVSATRPPEEVTGGVEGKVVRQRGTARTDATLASGKRRVRFFLSYAHADRALVDSLLSELEKQLSAAARYEYEIWSDGKILVGEKWHASVERAIDECDFGLLLVSPAFLGSRYIQAHELPAFVGVRGRKPVVAVGLAKVDLRHHDLRGLQEHQIFLKGGGRFFGELQGPKNKSDYVFELFTTIQERLDAHFEGPRKELHDALPIPACTEHFQRSKGFTVALRDLERIEGLVPYHARDALTEIEAWAVDEDAPPFFALLGEYGIGKTTALKQLTRELLERRKAGEDLPLPLYVDLREYVPSAKGAVPSIEELLESIIQRSWKVRDRGVTPEAVLRLVREEGALILFDGLDERIVHLSPDRAREFIRTLWAVLPDASRRAADLPPGKRRGKLLISCRSHYFRDIWSQNAMLLGVDREGVNRARFPAFCLLPFSEAQIEGYLESLLGERAGAAFKLIASIHDLPELARRPYLLSLITDRISELESLKARGEKVNAARVYDLIVRSWLNRDDGKHQLEPAHKRRLMEALAAALWRSGDKQWDADRLEEWFDNYLAANPALASAYADKSRAVLKEDLRTATFVLRPDTEQHHFRFAHTSIQEYFLASHLARALNEGRGEELNLPMISDEALEFLGQILSLGQPQPALLALETVLGGDVLDATLIAFRYWLQALRQSLPAPSPRRVNLSRANLEGWIIRGREGRPLDLHGANLSGVKLNRARVEHVDLNGANLTELEARQALFLGVDASRATARRADFCGLRWRGGTLQGADLRDAQLVSCQWVGVELSDASLPGDWRGHATSVTAGLKPIPPDSVRAPELTTLGGHSAWVLVCGWSPDGQRIVSGSVDSTLKVWDARSGECLLTLKGHSDSVRAFSWSPDGQRIVSGSVDSTLKVWDAGSGECLLTLKGHSGRVRTCGWSPDGQRIVSGSSDSTLKIWNAGTGEYLLALKGHSNSVWACAWSPDGRRILSSSDDHTLKVWDASSGDCLLTLAGHSDSALACGWSPDGRRVLSSSDDHTLKVWDASTGECLLTLSGHSDSVRTCGWSPDGQRIASGSDDSTLKVWDARTGECLFTVEGRSGSVLACGWSPDGQRIASGSSDNAIKVWDATGGECLLVMEGHSGRVRACGWSPEGQRIVSGSNDGVLKSWDATGGECLLVMEGHFGVVLACGWSPDGRRIVSGSDDNTLKVWDAELGECLLSLREHSSGVRACGWSPDGQRIVSGSDDNTLKVWEAALGECLLTLKGHSGSVWACGWSSQGGRIVSGSSDSTIKVWDAGTGECLLTMAGHSDSVRACGWSPDGRRIVSGSDDHTLKVWDANTGECLLILEGHSGRVRACGWSSDGWRIVSGADDNTLKVWDAGSGECLLTLEGHSGRVRACGWSPDGQRIVSGSGDSSLKAWDARSGECLSTWHLFPEGHAAMVDEIHQRVLHASPEAWRWLGWRVSDPETGRLRILPYEVFAELLPGRSTR